MKIEITEEEYKLLLEALLELPAKKSLGLIANLQNQRNKEAPLAMAKAVKENK